MKFIRIVGNGEERRLVYGGEGVVSEIHLRGAFLLADVTPIGLSIQHMGTDIYLSCRKQNDGCMVFVLPPGFADEPLYLHWEKQRCSRPGNPMLDDHALPATTSAQSDVEAPSRKRQRTEELFEDSRVVDVELFDRVRQYIYFHQPDNFKRCVTPLTERFAAIVRHGANASLKVGDPVIIHSYFNDNFEAPSKVEKIVENLDTIIVRLDDGAPDLCDKNIIDFSTLCKGTQYLMSSHLSLSAGIIASDLSLTSRLQFLGTSGSFNGDSGGACWSNDGYLVGMQCEAANVPLVTGPNGHRMARATDGRCGIVPITYIYSHILGMLPPEPVVYIEE